MCNLVKNLPIVTVLLASTTITNAVIAEQQKDFAAAISPNGKHMVYYSYRGTKLPDLYISDINGHHEHKLTDTPDLWEIVPAWSPDGKSVIYSAGSSMADLEIFQIDLHSKQVTQLTEGAGKGHTASWLPDSESIFYARMHEDGTSDIVRKWIKEGKEQSYTQDHSGRNLIPIVSPDGEKVAFVSDRDGDDLDIFVADIGFTHISQITADDIRQDFISWAPDSQQVIYSAPNHSGKHDLFAVDIHSQKTKVVAHSNADHQYFSSFSPDGKYLYFDQGDWNRNFFTYRAPWKEGELEAEQVSGKNWVDSIAIMEADFLAPMVGKWYGTSSFGRDKGRYEEKLNIAWTDNQKSLLVEMAMFWDGEEYGSSNGLLGLDREQQKMFFNLVMDDGTVIMQEQLNPGEAADWQMQVESHGATGYYLKNMYVEYSRQSKDQWKADIYSDQDGKRTLVSVHEFSRID